MVDATKVSSIKIDTGYAGVKEYPIFSRVNKAGETINPAQCSIVLGSNGSGKSTIARAFTSETNSIEFIDKDGEVIGGDSSNIYLFDEKFIIDNFRKLDDNYLGPIVLLGEAAKAQENVDKLNMEIRKKNKIKSRLEVNIENLEKAVKPLNKKIENSISNVDKNGTSLDSWRGRTGHYSVDKQYRNRPSGYVDRIKNEVVNLENMPARDDLLKEFTDKVDELNQSSDFHRIGWNPSKIILPFDVNKINEAMGAVKKIGEKDGDDKYYKRVYQSSVGVDELMRRLDETFSDGSLFCPHCFQDIDSKDKEKIIKSINEYIDDINSNREIQELQKLKIAWRPQKQKLPEINLSEDFCQDIEKDYSLLSNICESINAAIQEKIDSPEKDVKIDGINPSDTVDRINKRIDDILEKVAEYNSQGNKVEEIRRECERINHKLTVIETHEDIRKLKDLESDIAKINSKKLEVEQEIHGLSERLEFEEAKLRSESEAADRINELLSIVFGPDVISLEPAGSYGYRVLNKNQNVSPNMLSTGEQNILSLCYFFVKIADGDKYENSLSNNKIIILDDPISSFDHDNKFGVIKLLGYVVCKIFPKRSSSKLLITTHDIFVAYELSKLISYISSGLSLKCCNLQDEIIPTDFGYVDEYREMLTRMFRFAMDDTLMSPAPLANEIRRVWEAFLRFELGQSGVSNRSSIAKVQEYFEDHGMREKYDFIDKFTSLVYINTDSHSGHQMLGDNISLQPTLKPEDFRKFIKEILCFIHLVSPHHIALRLGGDSETIDGNREKIDELCRKIVGS